MITLGIDIGSATSKCVLLRDGKDIIASSIVNGGIGTEGSEEARSMVMTQSGIGPEDIDYVVATGYGRSLYEQADAQISELSCHAIGAHAIFPDVRTVIDIGGQDVKVMALEQDQCSSSELVLVKVRAERDSRGAVLKAAQTYGARVLDIGDATVTIEMTGQTDEMDRFVEHMESFGIREMARTGVTALERGDRTIHDEE